MKRTTRLVVSLVVFVSSLASGRAQNVSALTVESVWLAADRLLADRTYPDSPSRAPDPQIARDRQTLQRALASSSVSVRRAGVRSLGRFEDPQDAPALARFLDDPDDGVKIEAAQALGQSMHRSRDGDVMPAVDAIRSRLPRAAGEPRRQMLEALGRLKYTRATAQEIERWLVRTGSVDDVLVWLEPVVVRDRMHPFAPETREALVRKAAPQDPGAAPSAFAVRVLGPTLTENDAPLLMRAATYSCARAADPACGWEIRYAAIDAVNPARPAQVGALEPARRDPAFQVRVAALRKTAAITTEPVCAPLLAAFNDPMPIVRMEAMRLVDPKCSNRDVIAEHLVEVAGGLRGATGGGNQPPTWHLPARAFESLARFDPAGASTLLRDVAVPHAIWQVRATAARVAMVLKDDGALKTLAADREPNVQTAAIGALARLSSPAVTAVAIAALESTDHQLVRAAAMALQGTSEPDAAARALVHALQRLTKDQSDNSRDPRVAILERLKAIAPPDANGASRLTVYRGALEPFVKDFDPRVAALAGDVLEVATGTRPLVEPTRRAPMQPTEAELRALPRRMVLTMANGDEVELELLVDDAPLTVARFVELARKGYYNGLTFHRIEPLFVVQGLGPGANEYVGHPRFMRDEIGLARHDRGAVGISTRGRHTGDAQIFFDLIDVPRLNYDYTVFARVRRGMDAVDRMLEGAVLKGT